MKSIIAIFIVLLCATFAVAEDVKYEVKLKVTYNAVTPERADEIIGDAMRRHKDACKVEIGLEKVAEDRVSWHDGTDLFYVNEDGIVTFHNNTVD